MDVRGWRDEPGIFRPPSGMQGIEGVPSGVALNYEGFDESLSSIVRAFFEEKNIPTVGQMALLSELRRSFIYSASMFDEYLKADPLSIKERFGAFWLYFVQRPLGQRGNIIGIYFILFFKTAINNKMFTKSYVVRLH